MTKLGLAMMIVNAWAVVNRQHIVAIMRHFYPIFLSFIVLKRFMSNAQASDMGGGVIASFFISSQKERPSRQKMKLPPPHITRDL